MKTVGVLLTLLMIAVTSEAGRRCCKRLKQGLDELIKKQGALETKMEILISLVNKTLHPPPPPLPAECSNYQKLDSGDRHVRRGASPLLCDNKLGPAWFRFQGDAGTKMPTSCVGTSQCGTHATGWLNGAHPTPEEGIVTRKVCFSWTDCCTWSKDIHVLNCGDFFLYYISGTPHEHPCHLRYCGTD